MNNTGKLLRALIDALGFDIEVTRDYKEIKLTKEQASHHFKPVAYGSPSPSRRLLTESGSLAYLIDEDGMYTEAEATAIIDYKVTKRKAFVPLHIQSKEWGCIVDFVQSHREDIINDVNDYGGLGFILDFMERDSK